MLGIINLFIFILKYPSATSVKSDLALLDIGAGYFGHIDFMTASELSFSLPKDIAMLAAKTVKKMKEQHEAVTILPTEQALEHPIAMVPDNNMFHNDIVCPLPLAKHRLMT